MVRNDRGIDFSSDSAVVGECIPKRKQDVLIKWEEMYDQMLSNLQIHVDKILEEEKSEKVEEENVLAGLSWLFLIFYYGGMKKRMIESDLRMAIENLFVHLHEFSMGEMKESFEILGDRVFTDDDMFLESNTYSANEVEEIFGYADEISNLYANIIKLRENLKENPEVFEKIQSLLDDIHRLLLLNQDFIKYYEGFGIKKAILIRDNETINSYGTLGIINSILCDSIRGVMEGKLNIEDHRMNFCQNNQKYRNLNLKGIKVYDEENDCVYEYMGEY